MTAFDTPIPDRINMLQPGHNVGIAAVHDAVSKADNINQWTIYNLSFGGGANTDTVTLGSLAAAPDATNTAQKIVEGTNNGIHVLQSIVTPRGNSIGYFAPFSQVRLAVIAKAVERTRIALIASTNGWPAFLQGVQCVFDLAGNQIGVAATPFGTPLTPYAFQGIGQSITDLGGGWRLCYMDIVIGSIPTQVCSVTFALDNGTGTAAQSTSYAGDGASGVLTWRSSMLPTRAWALTQQLFFEDFNDLSGIDLADTRAPGFNFYLHGQMPLYGGLPAATDPTKLAISSPSVIRIDAPAVFSVNMDLTSFAVTGTNKLVGNVFAKPCLMEAKVHWDETVAPAGTSSFWSHDAVDQINPDGAARTFVASELDIYENSGAGGGFHLPEFTAAISIAQINAQEEAKIQSTPVDSYPVWNSGTRYIVNGVVFLSGVWYQCTVNNTNTQPPNAGFWNVISAPVPNGVFDFGQMHVYSALYLPYVSSTDFGVLMIFFDGIFAGGLMYGPDITVPYGSSMFQEADHLLQPLMLGTGPNYSTFCDWMSVYGLPQANLTTIPIHDSSATTRQTQGID